METQTAHFSLLPIAKASGEVD